MRPASPAWGPGLLLALIVLIGPVFAPGCRSEEPLRIGFLGGITTRGGELGIDGRDAALLAVDEVNRGGGVRGRRVELLWRDDHQDPARAVAAVRELVAAGAVALVGPMTSDVAVAIAPTLEELHLTAIAPTVSTNLLSHRADHFFRLYPSSQSAAAAVAEHALAAFGARRLLVVRDQYNEAHTGSWGDALRTAMEGVGGRVTAVVVFEMGQEGGIRALSQRLAALPGDAIFVLASPPDAGMIAQHLRLAGDQRPLFFSEWSFAGDLAVHGGAAVDDARVLATYRVDDGSPRYQAFVRAFRQRFSREPAFAAMHAYDATTVLLHTLARTNEPASLPVALVAHGPHEVLQGTVQLDEWGDALRPHYPCALRAGKLVELAAP